MIEFIEYRIEVVAYGLNRLCLHHCMQGTEPIIVCRNRSSFCRRVLMVHGD